MMVQDQRFGAKLHDAEAAFTDNLEQIMLYASFSMASWSRI